MDKLKVTLDRLGINTKAKKLLLMLLVAGLLVISAVQALPLEQTVKDAWTLGSQSAQAAGVADATADGTDDQVQALALLTALPATGGRISILTGTYSWANLANVTRAIGNVTIDGTGNGTYIDSDGVTAPFTAGGNNWVFSNMRFDAPGPNMGATTGWMWTNVWVGATYYAYRSPYGQSAFNDVTVASLTDSGLTSTRIPIAGVGGLLGDDADLTFNGSYLDTPVGRSATITVAAFDATALEKAQADYVCGAADADTVIETALTAAVASGRGSVTLIGDTFNGVDEIDAISNVNVYGSGVEIVIDNTTGAGVVFTSTTNTYWADFTIRLTGVAAVGNACMRFEGTTDETTVVENVTAYNDRTGSGGAAFGTLDTAHPIVRSSTGYSSQTAHAQAFAISGSALNDGTIYSSYPTVIDSYMESRGNGTTANNGFDVEGTNPAGENTTSTQPLLINCIGRGSREAVSSSHGFSFKWGTGARAIGCIGYAGGGNLSAGISCESQSTPILENCTGIAQDGIETTDYFYGIQVIDASRPILNSCTGLAEPFDYRAASLLIDNQGSPVVNGGYYGFLEHQKIFIYDDANNGRFRPFADNPYQLVSLWVYVAVAHPGETIDIGTSIAGNEIANNVTIAASSFPVIVQAQVAADGYLYITPSVAITDADIHIYYTVAKNYAGTYALRAPLATASGYYLVNGATFEATTASFALAAEGANGILNKCTFKNLTTNSYGDWSALTLYIYNSTFINVSFTGYPILPTDHKNRFIGYLLRNSGTASVLNTTTSIAVAHGLSGTPSRIMITPRENPTNAVAFWWVDTVGAANFTINVNADPGASHLDFDWVAWVGEGN